MKTVALHMLVAFAVGGSVVTPAVAAAKPSATARMTVCERALAAGERVMVAEGQMKTAPGAARLQIRFELEVRTPQRPRFVAVRAPGFGTWNTAAPAPQRFVYGKRVENLAAPADYRMVVRFRWLDAQGRRLAAARRLTGVCTQADLRPDLTPLRITIEPGPASGTARYVVPLRNVGPTPAGPFATVLTIGGRPVAPQLLGGLAAGARAVLAFSAPACAAGQIVSIRADADAVVDESDEADNVLSRSCPASVAAPGPPS